MGDRDAFGREKDEDTLAEMGWVTNFKDPPPATAPPPPPPAETPQPTQVMPAPEFQAQLPPPRGPAPGWQPPQPSARPRRAPRRRRGRFPFKLVFLLVVIGAIWAFNVPSRIKDQIDDTTRSIHNSLPQLPSATPNGASLLTRSGLTAALAKLPAGKVTLMRVSADNVTATLQHDGKQRVAIIAAGRVITSTAPGIPGQKAVSVVDPAAPARMVRKHKSVDYLVLMREGNKTVWLLYLDDGTHYRADAHGRHAKQL